MTGESRETGDDLFIHWRGAADAQRRFLRPVVTLIVCAALAIGAALALSQRDPGATTWDTSAPRAWEGRLHVQPYPLLALDDGRVALLVLEGKHGAAPRLAGLHDQRVAVLAHPLQRGDQLMLELLPGDDAVRPLDDADSAEPAATTEPPSTGPGPTASPPAAGAPLTWTTRGPVVFRGEILDAKCHLGAMRPGDGKSHKACATLCLDGGIPPLLIARDNLGNLRYLLIVAPDGGPANTTVRDFAGEPVTVRGELLEATRGLDLLRVAPDGVTRLRAGD